MSLCPSKTEPLRIAIFGTHPQQYNGYSKVVYELVCQLSRMEDVKVFVFGFQKFYSQDNNIRPDIPPNVTVYDAMADESPKSAGFGINLVKNFVAMCNPHVAVVYNDLSVLCTVLNELKDVPDRRFKIIAYIDQVYLCQKKRFIDFVNQHADAAMMFTPGWTRCIQEQGIILPCYDLPHGLNSSIYYPIPRDIVRKYYGFGEDEFLVLNMNRNQPRKRWDTCLKAFAELVARHPDSPIKLIVGTAPRGAWDLMEIYERELMKRGIHSDHTKQQLVFVNTPQRNSDRDVNLLYNLCDVGINTCDGEGFGLCNFEHAAVGKPQVVTRLGAFPDVFDDGCSQMVDPVAAVYLDSTRDVLGGEALICDYTSFADAMESYFLDPKMRTEHGKRARASILRKYRWDDIARSFRKICFQVTGAQEKSSNDIVYTCETRDDGAHNDGAHDEHSVGVTQETTRKQQLSTLSDSNSSNMSMDDVQSLMDSMEQQQEQKDDEDSNNNGKVQHATEDIDFSFDVTTKAPAAAKGKERYDEELSDIKGQLAQMQSMMMTWLSSCNNNANSSVQEKKNAI